jgi:hypothetical protein
VLQSGSAYIEAKAVTWLRKQGRFINDQNTEGNGAGGKAAEIRLRESLKRMKENIEQKLDENCSIEVESLRRALYKASQYIQQKVNRELIHLFDEAHSKQPPLKFWQDLKLILGGGGASSPAYRNAAIWAFTLKSSRKKEQKEPELIDLPKPGDFEMGKLHRKYFHRFAVAYGLSHRNVDLPEVASPSQIRPQSVSRDPILISAPSKDEC